MFIWLPGFDHVCPRGHHASMFFLMNTVAAETFSQFLHGAPPIIQALLIDEFEFAFRRHSINKAGNAIDYLAKTLFALAEGFLGPLPLFDLSCNALPPNHAPTGIPQRLGTGTEPAIDIIEPPHTLAYLT